MQGFTLGIVDIVVFVAFIIAVISIGLIKSKGGENSEDYFLAGRGLKWWLIGFSLIAANISTEQFVGMSGSAASSLGIAIASYEWMAAITLVVVGFVFLPHFLRAGIYTIPEFLEYRYNAATRIFMAALTMFTYVGITIAAVVYSGAVVINTLFPTIDIAMASIIIGAIAAVYVTAGGLKASVWADLIQGSALILGGAIVVVWAMKELGHADLATIGATAEQVQNLGDAGVLTKFKELNADKLHMILPASNPAIPWTALVIGLWLPNFYYWGLNQYIMQRTLGASSLVEGQKGVVFAAALKLIVPFIIVIPGIIAFNLFKPDMTELAYTANNRSVLEAFAAADASTGKEAFAFNADFAAVQPETAAEIIAYNATVANAVPAGETPMEKNAFVLSKLPAGVTVHKTLIGYHYDSAFALLIKKLIPTGLRGFMLAAILGAVVSSLASMLNSASTVFTIDFYRRFFAKHSTEKSQVFVGRICVVLFTVIGCAVAPQLANPKFGGVFNFIQEFQGYISPGILGVFIFGLIVKKAPAMAGVAGLIVNPVAYQLLKMYVPQLAFLNRMAICLGIVFIVMAIITLIKPAVHPGKIQAEKTVDLTPSKDALIVGIIVVVATLALYVYFW
ncbi:MAG: sodium/solute symporter [Kiritimatiellales bacterium]